MRSPSFQSLLPHYFHKTLLTFSKCALILNLSFLPSESYTVPVSVLKDTPSLPYPTRFCVSDRTRTEFTRLVSVTGLTSRTLSFPPLVSV